jgi:hypothetical protein
MRLSLITIVLLFLSFNGFALDEQTAPIKEEIDNNEGDTPAADADEELPWWHRAHREEVPKILVLPQ